ncbi:Hypothetical predicted protein [Marmota monax]|uniref:Uncharacterized protein n=1 Tax=Marmota monax TaxID=9995 RepID=A0A5E4BC06_MARMO|nr:Hypothetical predicted protein [Marmota monax]
MQQQVHTGRCACVSRIRCTTLTRRLSDELRQKPLSAHDPSQGFCLGPLSDPHSSCYCTGPGGGVSVVATSWEIGARSKNTTRSWIQEFVPHPRLQDETNLRLEAENNLAAYRQVRKVEGRVREGGSIDGKHSPQA